MIPAAFQAHARLLQEPWGKMPWEVAKLDTQQVVELYLKPAAEAARRFGGGGVPRTKRGTQPDSFEEFAAALHGQTAPDADLRAMYADYVKAWHQEGA